MNAPTGAGSLERNVDRLGGEVFDWLVIGGGAYGVGLLFEAARRGQRALLLEAADFGGETSWHSLRILHGGFRYLQTLDLGRFRQSMAERRWFFRHFPDLTSPLDCLLPLYGRGLRRPAVFRLALPLDALLSLDRNIGVAESHHLRAGRVLSRSAALALVPGLRDQGLEGAAFWQDGAMARSEALLIEWLRWAVALGGAALNRMRVREITVERGQVTGVIAEDGGGGEVRFRAAAVVNAAGPWCRSLAAAADRDRPEVFHASLAFNLLLDRPPMAGDVAVAVEPGDVGTLFLHPHQGRILVGTRHLPYAGPLSRPAAAAVSAAAIASVLDALNKAFPGLGLGRGDVVEVRAGFLPAVGPGEATQAKRPVIVDHGAAGGPVGLHTVSGVKWTTARAVAAAFFDRLGIAAATTTPARPPAASELALSAAAFVALADDEARAWLGRMRRALAAATVEDVLCRRTGWNADPRHGDAARARLAALWRMAPVSVG